MRTSSAILALAFGSALATPAFAGCLTGGAVGAVAGHALGHGVAGAAAGCAIGHHEANKAAKQKQATQAAQRPDNNGRSERSSQQ